MTNVLKIIWDQALTGSMMAQVDSGWVQATVGQYTYYRLYEFNNIPPGQSISDHWNHTGNNNEGASDYQTAWRNASGPAADSVIDNRFGVGVSSNPASTGRGQGYFINSTDMKVGQLYRREWRVERTDTDSIRVNVRVYNASGTLVLTGANFKCGIGGCVDGGGYNVDTIGQFKTEYTGTNGYHSIEIGNNGPSTEPSTPSSQYIGGYAVRVSSSANDWIGPYPVGAEVN